MTTISVIMLLVSCTIVWGGLAVSVIFLMRHPEGSVTLLDDHGNTIELKTEDN